MFNFAMASQDPSKARQGRQTGKMRVIDSRKCAPLESDSLKRPARYIPPLRPHIKQLKKGAAEPWCKIDENGKLLADISITSTLRPTCNACTPLLNAFIALNEQCGGQFFNYEGTGCKAIVYLGKLYLYEGLPFSFAGCRRCGAPVGCAIAKTARGLVAWFQNTELLPRFVFTIPPEIEDTKPVTVVRVEIRNNIIHTIGHNGVRISTVGGKKVDKIPAKWGISANDFMFTVDGRISALLFDSSSFRIVTF